MQTEYIDILGIYPGMHSSKFTVRKDSWEHFCDNYMNYPDPGNCFLPCKDTEGDALFVDMTKLLAFYVLKKDPVKKDPSKKNKKNKSGAPAGDIL
jgi:hypothetical protein